MSIHMRIVSGHELVADLPEWEGPVPAKGDYLYHPPFGNQDVIPGMSTDIAGSVKTVTWRVHDRNPQGTAFIMTAHPYVEIHI